MKLVSYTVIGSGSFPIDMLRYDQAFPASEYDSGIMAESGNRQVRLNSYSAHAGKLSVSRQRWESFGWTVR